MRNSIIPVKGPKSALFQAMIFMFTLDTSISCHSVLLKCEKSPLLLLLSITTLWEQSNR